MIDKSKRSQHIITMGPHVNELMKLGETISLNCGTFFMRAGIISEYCYIVKKGKVVSCETYANGKTRNGLIMDEGSLIGESFVILGEPCPINFKTIEPTQLVRIHRNQLISYLEQNPNLYKIIIESLSKKLLSTMDEVRQMAGYNITWRICNLLLVFAEHYGKPVGNMICIDTRISQQNIAYLLYANRITVVRVFKKLQDRQLITRINNLYYITDLNAFKAYMEIEACNDNL